MNKKKILIVDDEVRLCRILKLNLEEAGNYEVKTESRSTNAMAAVFAFHPDLIVLDYVMPEMDGADVLKQLEANPKTQKIPIIFLTAVATKEDTNEQGTMIGGHFVIAKPVAMEELIEAIERKLMEKGYS